jgi:hypothetical protein
MYGVSKATTLKPSREKVQQGGNTNGNEEEGHEESRQEEKAVTVPPSEAKASHFFCASRPSRSREGRLFLRLWRTS